MKRYCLILVCACASILMSCDWSPNVENIVVTHLPISMKYEQEQNDTLTVVNYLGTEFPVQLAYFFESEQAFLRVNNDVAIPVLLDWSLYEDIRLFTSQNGYLMIVPTYSEEFPTFLLLDISKDGSSKSYGYHTFNFKDVEMHVASFPELKYSINELDGEPRIYANTNKSVLLTETFEHSEDFEALSDKQLAQIKALQP